MGLKKVYTIIRGKNSEKINEMIKQIKLKEEKRQNVKLIDFKNKTWKNPNGYRWIYYLSCHFSRLRNKNAKLDISFLRVRSVRSYMPFFFFKVLSFCKLFFHYFHPTFQRHISLYCRLFPFFTLFHCLYLISIDRHRAATRIELVTLVQWFSTEVH